MTTLRSGPKFPSSRAHDTIQGPSLNYAETLFTFLSQSEAGYGLLRVFRNRRYRTCVLCASYDPTHRTLLAHRRARLCDNHADSQVECQDLSDVPTGPIHASKKKGHQISKQAELSTVLDGAQKTIRHG